MIQRLGLSEMPDDLREALQPRVDRLGYLGEFFQCGANQPEALLHFVRFSEAARGGLSDRIAELIALTVATLAGNSYERNQHERLATRLGLDREWVHAVEQLDPNELTDDAERAVQAFLLAALPSQGQRGSRELEAVTSHFGDAGAIAVLFLAGRYLAHALVVNTLELVAPVPSIFEDGLDHD